MNPALKANNYLHVPGLITPQPGNFTASKISLISLRCERHPSLSTDA